MNTHLCYVGPLLCVVVTCVACDPSDRSADPAASSPDATPPETPVPATREEAPSPEPNSDGEVLSDAPLSDVAIDGQLPELEDAGSDGSMVEVAPGNVRRSCSPDGFHALLLRTSPEDASCDLDADNGARVQLVLYVDGGSVFPLPLGEELVLGSDLQFAGQHCPGGGPCSTVQSGTISFDTLVLSGEIRAPASMGYFDLQLENGVRLRRTFSAYLCDPEPESCPNEL